MRDLQSNDRVVSYWIGWFVMMFWHFSVSFLPNKIYRNIFDLCKVQLHESTQIAIFLGTKYPRCNHGINSVTSLGPYSRWCHKRFFVLNYLRWFQQTNQNHKVLCCLAYQVVNSLAWDPYEWSIFCVSNRFPGTFDRSKRKLHFRAASFFFWGS